MIDINHQSVRWSQWLADKNKKKYCILSNDFGGLDIKPSDTVSPYVNNQKILAEIEPAKREAKILFYSRITI